MPLFLASEEMGRLKMTYLWLRIMEVVHHLWYDINIINLSNQTLGSYCSFGGQYELPPGMIKNTDNSKNFLAGNYNQWLTTEI